MGETGAFWTDAQSGSVQAAYALSGFFALTWMVAAVWTRRTVRRPVFGSQTLYLLLFLGGVGLIFGGGSAPSPWPWPLDWLMVAAVAASFVFCWWARIYLGSLWSASVSAKAGQKIVNTGPYAIVRHPIYTGMISAGLFVAVLRMAPIALAGVVVFTIGCWIKAKMEETILRQELGAEAYDAYAAVTPMLIPFLKL